jgi:hypothetical protein
MANRWFTPDSARRALVRLRPAAERMCRIYRGLEQHPAEIGSDKRVDAGYLELVRGLHEVFGELVRAGVRIQDIKSGLVDFPARRSGREVLLCWRVGERRLSHWHELDHGFDGRRPVDEDGPWETDDGTKGDAG